MSDNKSAFSFQWKLENFGMLPHQLGEYIESPSFDIEVATGKKVECCLQLYPRGQIHEDYLGLSLTCTEAENLKINFTVMLESTEFPDDSRILEQELVLQEGWDLPFFVRLSDMYAEKNLYLPQDTLTFWFEINEAWLNITRPAENGIEYAPVVLKKKNYFFRTCIQVQRRSIMWPIWNVDVEEPIERPEITSILLPSSLKSSPNMQLVLNWEKIAIGDDIPILINQTCISSQDLFVKCKITVTSRCKESEISETSSHLFKRGISDVWHFPPFLTASMLTDKKFLNVDDMFLLMCEFAFSHIDAIHHSENNYLPLTFKRRQKNSELGTGFKNIYGSGRFCDVELKAGGRMFPYFKAILCTRSSVFAAMFETDMSEKASNVVEIEDVDPDTLDRMLVYLHSDVLQEGLSLEDACDLYRVADKYNVEPLQSRCSVLLATLVSVSNVCDLLVLADTYLDSFLMTVVSNFICSHTAEVFVSTQWKSLMKDNPKLSCDIMHKIWIGAYHI